MIDNGNAVIRWSYKVKVDKVKAKTVKVASYCPSAMWFSLYSITAVESGQSSLAGSAAISLKENRDLRQLRWRNTSGDLFERCYSSPCWRSRFWWHHSPSSRATGCRWRHTLANERLGVGRALTTSQRRCCSCRRTRWRVGIITILWNGFICFIYL